MLERINLSKLEIDLLKELQRNEKYKKDYVKITCIIMLNMGMSVEIISISLGLDVTTIRRYGKSFKELGLDKYLESNYHINTGKLNISQKELLKLELSTNFHQTSSSICDWIKTEFEISYTSEGLVPLLHKLGFTYKKTKQEPCNYDIDKQLKFIEEFEKINANLSETEAIYFSDAVHPQHNTKSSYGWILKGEEKEIKAVSGRQRLNINGLLNANNVTDIIAVESPTINMQSTLELYKKLELENLDKTKIYVICDNARYYKNKDLFEWLKTSKIEQVFLPPYSPNLNIIERLWKFLKKEVINSTFYRTFSLFKESVMAFFQNTEKYKKKLETLLTLKFHVKKMQTN
jgi:transposase